MKIPLRLALALLWVRHSVSQVPEGEVPGGQKMASRRGHVDEIEGDMGHKSTMTLHLKANTGSEKEKALRFLKMSEKDERKKNKKNKKSMRMKNKNGPKSGKTKGSSVPSKRSKGRMEIMIAPVKGNKVSFFTNSTDIQSGKSSKGQSRQGMMRSRMSTKPSKRSKGSSTVNESNSSKHMTTLKSSKRIHDDTEETKGSLMDSSGEGSTKGLVLQDGKGMRGMRKKKKKNSNVDAFKN